MDDKPAIFIGRQNASHEDKTSDDPIGGRSKAKLRTVLADPPSQQLVDECLDYFRPMLRDPRGAYADKAQLQTVKNRERPDFPEWREVVLDGRATNGFGGYVAQKFNCILNSAGSVDQEASKVYKAFFTLGVNPS